MAAREVDRPTISDLQLEPAQNTMLAEVLSASVAVNVYRQLEAARGDSGCQIIGNCSSCSKLVTEQI